MTEQEILEQARKLHRDAYRLLFEEGPHDIVSAVGPTAAIGSFALDLMTWPDLDITLQLPHEHDVGTFFELGRAIATKP